MPPDLTITTKPTSSTTKLPTPRIEQGGNPGEFEMEYNDRFKASFDQNNRLFKYIRRAHLLNNMHITNGYALNERNNQWYLIID